jgi:hypothetical protein
MLAPELHIVQTARTKAFPKNSFGGCFCLSQITSCK